MHNIVIGWTPEHTEATVILFAIFITFFLGVGFSIQCMACERSEKLINCYAGGILLLISLSLIIYYFL